MNNIGHLLMWKKNLFKAFNVDVIAQNNIILISYMLLLAKIIQKFGNGNSSFIMF